MFKKDETKELDNELVGSSYTYWQYTEVTASVSIIFQKQINRLNIEWISCTFVEIEGYLFDLF